MIERKMGRRVGFLTLAVAIVVGPADVRAAVSPDGAVAAQPWRAVSPNGEVACAVTFENGRLTAAVSYRGKRAFTSELGVRSRRFRYEVLGVSSHESRGTWKPVWGFRREYADNYAELEIRLGEKGVPVTAETICVRCADEGFAARSKIALKTYHRETVGEERFDWTFAEGSEAWAIAGTEATYPEKPIPIAALKENLAYRMPLTLRVPGAGYASVFEAHAEGWPRSFLRAEKGVLKQRYVAGVLEGRGERLSPWRAVLLAPTPGGLVERAHFVENLNPPCALADTSWIRPGFCVSDMGNCPLQTDKIVAIAGTAAQTGAKYLQVDWGWYGTEYPWSDDDRASYAARHPELKGDDTWIENSKADPRTPASGTVPYHPYWNYDGYTGVSLDIPKVIAALRAHGLGLCLYVHGMVLERADLDELFALYEKWGVAGLKPGFVGYGSQTSTDFLRRMAATAAKHRLWLDIHDEHVPDGFERTWPNVMITEGGGGEEGNHPVRQDVSLPFTRCLVGPFDFTPHLFFEGKSGATKAHRLAMFVCYPGPTAVMRGGIADLVAKHPAATAFLRALPWTYDETRVPEGEIGRFITVVREKGGSYYMGGLTGTEARESALALDFLPAGRDFALELLVDDLADASASRGFSVIRRTVRRGDVLKVKLAANGGFCGRLTCRQLAH